MRLRYQLPSSFRQLLNSLNNHQKTPVKKDSQNKEPTIESLSENSLELERTFENIQQMSFSEKCASNEELLVDSNHKSSSESCSVDVTVLSRVYETPAQALTEDKLKVLNHQLHAKELARDSGLADPGIQKEINGLRKNIKKEEKNLKEKKIMRFDKKKYRPLLKTKLLAAAEIPEVSNILKLRKEPGRSRIEKSQLDLHKTIIDIAIHCSGADSKRRTEIISCCRTLDDLHEHLLKLGFNLSRTSTYYRLLPKNQRSNSGKRHVETVPVRLCRARTDMHKKHRDGEFAKSSILSLEELASILGPEQVGWISQDDKAKVPLGLPAANKQTSVLMHIEYRVQLPDHDWVIAAKHKLTPSVYADASIEPHGSGSPEAVGYSDPTYITIRSGKHSSNTAATHSRDFDKLVELDLFKSILKIYDGKIKPEMVIDDYEVFAEYKDNTEILSEPVAVDPVWY
ncbi:uncharacterized protein LOC127288626 [Leptopilina boulardi]|uniref:uncharacterized protein LOC127288626 n=1 Tax=Leptopilina boulardi TaxID=63433 RepID=UPI0021F646E8|nr:uncharacterized protein LOC127288626 [Leptopilina boulardi]